MKEAPVPPDLDLRDFQYMPLDVVRLVDSDLTAIASGEEFKAAVLLWCKAWHQVPAASLPNDDRMLAHLAGYGRDVKGWKKVRDMALRGFEVADDGRLYHPVIVEKALDAAKAKRARKEQTEAATKARLARRAQRDDAYNTERDDQRNVEADEQRNEARNVDQQKGEGRERDISIALASDTARTPVPVHWQAIDAILASHGGALGDWEHEFLHSIKRKPSLTKPQQESLKSIQDKVSAALAPQQILPTVRRGTPEFEAWIAHYRAKGSGKFAETMDVLTVPTMLPPQDSAA